MENIIQADIFFFITGIAVIIFTICTIVVMFYVTRILRDMKSISKTMLRESDNIADDIESVREAVRSEGAKVRTV
ncbi:MAG: hypothetical protein UT90_C0009G0001, partial [Parcubacteria group bacterium GW2011_GWA1_40_21]